MKKPKKLVMLTKSYPFDKGEEFIENELPVISSYFDEIIIIATACTKRSVQTRHVDNNVHVYRLIDIKNLFFRYSYYCIKGILSKKSDILATELKKNSCIKGKLATLYIHSRTANQYIKIKKMNIFTDKESEYVIYTYWFSDLPLLGMDIKEELPLKSVVVSRAHGYDLYPERNISGVLPFREYVLKNIDAVYTCSEAGRRYLVDNYPLYKDKVFTSYLGTKDHGFRKKNTSDVFQLLTCSRLIPLKQLNILAEALKIIENNTSYNIKWICIGNGPMEKQLKQFVKNNLKRTTVDFTGYMSNTEVMNFYETISPDLFVNVSNTEGLPVAVMEAISFGIPVMATDVGGTSEIVKDDITGVLLPQKITSDFLAQKITEFIEEKAVYDKARDYWKKNFDADLNYKKFATTIITMLKD